jgi:hypothetical protein
MAIPGSNAWTATSGTGKMKGITAKGTCTAKGKPDGSTHDHPLHLPDPRLLLLV